MRGILVSFLLAVTAFTAGADITTCQNTWDVLPQVQISVGNNNDCGQNTLKFNGRMARGACLGPWPGTGAR
jgi:hypothetical protein